MAKHGQSHSTYRKANFALGVTALGLAAAFPFQTQFWGGLITSGCSAGLIGGLADWFAVTALFRKPLNIRPGRIIRTEIIPRNRERIFQELTHMVQDELLSQEALIQKLTVLDFAAIFKYIADEEGLAKLEPSLQALASCLLESVNQFDREPFLSNQSHAITQVLREVYRRSLVKGTVRSILEILIHELNLGVQSPEMRRTLTQWIDDALADYVSQNSSRKIVQMFIPESSTLAVTIQMQVSNELTGGQAVQSAQEWLGKFIEGPRFDRLIERYLPEILKKGEKSILDNLQTRLSRPEDAHKGMAFILRYIENYRLELEQNLEKQVSFNHKIQTFLTPVVAQVHERIGRFVRDGLEKYSNEMLVDLIEDKAGDDLQMIRINGSVVGGLAGVLFYLVNFLF